MLMMPHRQVLLQPVQTRPQMIRKEVFIRANDSKRSTSSSKVHSEEQGSDRRELLSPAASESDLVNGNEFDGEDVAPSTSKPERREKPSRSKQESDSEECDEPRKYRQKRSYSSSSSFVCEDEARGKAYGRFGNRQYIGLRVYLNFAIIYAGENAQKMMFRHADDVPQEGNDNDVLDHAGVVHDPSIITGRPTMLRSLARNTEARNHEKRNIIGVLIAMNDHQ
ncbi:unnamed protein product [Toxocara canis]|uniref:AP2/ERF domain-containing protein n=1 Tax=Toxocara canis TaxID=6265 RepID=A0A183U1V0_TOXCA|nr:unnamed protein product [Toxocara canis]